MKAKVTINGEHAVKLLAGETVTIHIPANTDTLELALKRDGDRIAIGSASGLMGGMAKIMDVFFNGRRA